MKITSRKEQLEQSVDRLQTGRTLSFFNKLFDERVILAGYRGSIAHNLYTKENTDDLAKCDTDTFKLYCFRKEYYWTMEGYYHSREVYEEKIEDIDLVAYEIRKAVHLLSGCNPNVMTFLYNRPESYTTISEGGKILLENRDLFLAKKRIKDAYGGYAYAQLTRLQGGAYKGYMGDKRKQLVDIKGYDTKNAMTLIRLLKNGIELLENGEMQVYRTKDRDFLMDIKRGKYKLTEVKELADEYFNKIDLAYEKSILPEVNNKKKISKLLVSILEAEHI